MELYGMQISFFAIHNIMIKYKIPPKNMAGQPLRGRYKIIKSLNHKIIKCWIL